MEDEKKIVVHKGFVYENKQANDRELKAIYDNLYTSLKGLSNAMNLVKDQNQKKALAGNMRAIRLTFNDKIKDPTLYSPKSIDDMQTTAQNVDQKMKAQQGLSQSTPSSPDQPLDDRSSQAS